MTVSNTEVYCVISVNCFVIGNPFVHFSIPKQLKFFQYDHSKSIILQRILNSDGPFNLVNTIILEGVNNFVYSLLELQLSVKNKRRLLAEKCKFIN